jgi:hypothetical protein
MDTGAGTTAVSTRVSALRARTNALANPVCGGKRQGRVNCGGRARTVAELLGVERAEAVGRPRLVGGGFEIRAVQRSSAQFRTV